MNINNLATELNNHLNKHGDDPNFWNRDKIGKIIKRFCKRRGNFRNAPRGNPRKGFDVMMENKYQE